MYGLHAIVYLSVIIIDCNNIQRNTKTRSSPTVRALHASSSCCQQQLYD